MEINQAISLIILKKIESGMSIMDALKETVGAENVESMISEIYETLRCK